MYPILAGGASASTSFVGRHYGAVKHSPMRFDSPVKHTFFYSATLNPSNGVDVGSIPTFDEKFFFRLSKSGYIRGTMNN